MVLFCPTCGNILLVEDIGGLHRFYCQTCPYIFPITSKVASTLSLPRKKVDDVMGEEAAWANAARELATCPKCTYPEAFFQQLQLRSADEPMTVFYKCCKCGHRWKEG